MTEETPVATRFIQFIDGLRRHLRALLAALVLISTLYYFLSPILLSSLQHHLGQRLAFFSVAEPFLAHAKLALASAIFTLIPAISYCIWQGLAKPFGITNHSLGWFVLFTCCLFYAGATFCYTITLPFGINFLLNFQSHDLKPVISVGKFISFVTIFILAFGVIFELPIFMIFAGQAGLVPRTTFEKNRRYAVLAMSIVAALLTPTPDVINMLLMGIPLYLLYELGILVMRLMRL